MRYVYDTLDICYSFDFFFDSILIDSGYYMLKDDTLCFIWLMIYSKLCWNLCLEIYVYLVFYVYL